MGDGASYPRQRRRGRIALLAALVLAFCVPLLPLASAVRADEADEPAHSAALDAAIKAAAKRHGVPERLVRRIIMRESKYNARAHNRAFWGLMQISYPTAVSMGFRGTREELLNPFVNLRYAVPYLANAFRIAERQEDAAVRLYAAGYYFTARSKGLLNVLRTADSPPLAPEPVPSAPILTANANAQPPQSVGFFGALFSPGRQPPPQAPATQFAANVDSAAAPAPAPARVVASDAPATTEMPKKWLKDGGMSVIARGEQSIAQMADHRSAAADEDGGARSHKHKPKKITLVADLDVPLTSAPAYATTPQQDPRFAASQSQAAITDATSGDAPRQSMDAGVDPRSAPPAPAAEMHRADAPEAPTRVAPKLENPSGKTLKAATKPTKVARRRKDETKQALADKPLDLAPAK